MARHILFLSLLLEPADKIGLRGIHANSFSYLLTLSLASLFLLLSFFSEKVELFLELYGNSLIRPQTLQYLREKSNELIKYVLCSI